MLLVGFIYVVVDVLLVEFFQTVLFEQKNLVQDSLDLGSVAACPVLEDVQLELVLLPCQAFDAVFVLTRVLLSLLSRGDDALFVVRVPAVESNAFRRSINGFSTNLTILLHREPPRIIL